MERTGVHALEGVSRISVVGPSGSGKTRLSRQLHDRLSLPLHELDSIRFDRSGRAQAMDAFVASVEEVINRDSWIVDGHYRDTRSMVWRRSQLVIWLNLPLPLVFWRLLRRGVAKNFARVRAGSEQKNPEAWLEPDNRRAAAGWRTRLNRLVKTIRERSEYRSMLASIEARGVRILELRSAREANELHFWLRREGNVDRGRASASSIELFGLPGAGKTTLTKAIDRDHDLKTRHELASEWKRQSILRRAVVGMRTAADLRLMLAAVRLAVGARLNNRESLWRLVRLLSMKHWLRTRSGVLLFDQGMMQNLWSILYASNCRDPDPRVVEPLLRALYDGSDTQIVLLEIDQALAARRVADRTYGRSRFDGLDEPEVDALLARAKLVVAALTEAAREVGLAVRTLDGADSVAELAKSLEAMVTRQEESQSGRPRRFLAGQDGETQSVAELPSDVRPLSFQGEKEGRTVAGPLPVAGELADRLAKARVRYGVYKNTRLIEAGLAGLGDLDLLVSVDDAAAFRSVVRDLGGVRGVSSPLYDNAVAGREDWFIPGESGRYLHLDTSFGLRIGRKFSKRYEALTVLNVTEWQVPEAPAPRIPKVSLREEARIAILRSVFRLPLWPGQAWVRADADTSSLLKQVFVHDRGEETFDFQFAQSMVPCIVRRRGGGFALQGGAIRQIRNALRARGGDRLLAAPSDFIAHHARRCAYFVAKMWTAARPGKSVAKRRLEPAGVIVALIGPDGVGKSTQAVRLAATFRRSFRSASVYLGSNDGDWMRFRAALRGRISRARGHKGAIRPSGIREIRSKRRSLHVLGSAIWRLVIAVQRQAAMRRAMRLAAAGAVVIADRWPQTLRQGILDGPSVPPPRDMRLAHLLSRIEHRIYRAMERHKPTLTIHLDCDFATSHARKPGDIMEEDFERRIDLMREMRRCDPGVVMVDARKDMDAVTADLIRLVWSAMRDAGDRSASAQTLPSHRLEAAEAVG